jgi:hypothetical protein
MKYIVKHYSDRILFARLCNHIVRGSFIESRVITLISDEPHHVFMYTSQLGSDNIINGCFVY